MKQFLARSLFITGFLLLLHTTANAAVTKPSCCQLSIKNTTEINLVVKGELCDYELFFDGFAHVLPSQVVTPDSIEQFTKCYKRNTRYSIYDNFQDPIIVDRTISSNQRLICSRTQNGISCE